MVNSGFMCSELCLHKKGEKKTKRGEESERRSTTLHNECPTNGKLATNVKPEMTPFHKSECKKKKKLRTTKIENQLLTWRVGFPLLYICNDHSPNSTTHCRFISKYLMNFSPLSIYYVFLQSRG